MRILRLDFGPALGTVDLHPFISVVHGVDPAQADAVIDAIRSLATGADAGVGGLVEEDGDLIELPAPPGAVGPFTIDDVVLAVDAGMADASGLPALRAERDQMRRQAEIDAVSVEVIRADLDPAALARVKRIRDLMAGVVPVSPADLDRERARHAVEQALVEVGHHDPLLREARQEVAPLIEQWKIYREALDAAKPHLDRLEANIVGAESKREQAAAELAQAEQQAVPVVLTPEEDRRVVELSTGEIDGKKARRRKKRTEAEDAELESLLAKVGQTTYPAYAMYRMAPQASPENLALVARARERLAQVTAEVEEARAELSIDPAAAELAFQFDAIKTEARQHLGPMLPDDLGEALASLVDERPNPAWMEALAGLYDELAAAGVEISDELEPADLVPLGWNWLDETGAPSADDGPSRVELESQLAEAEATLDRHGRAMARIDQLEAAADRSVDRLAQLEASIEQAESGLGNQASDLLAMVDDVAARLDGVDGPLAPVVLLGDFVGLDDDAVCALFDRYESLASRVQVIAVTNRASAIDWAAEAGLRRALRSTLVTSIG